MSTCSHSDPDQCGGVCGDACRCKGQRTGRAGYVRIPGLFRAWEVEDLLAAGGDLHIEPGGTTDDDTPVYIVFRREGGRP